MQGLDLDLRPDVRPRNAIPTIETIRPRVPSEINVSNWSSDCQRVFMIQELRFGVRMLLKSPGFSAMAIATLSLAIGGSAAVDSIIRAVEYGNLPFANADRLVRVSETKEDGTPGGMSLPTFEDFRAVTQALESIAAYAGYELTSGDSTSAERVRSELVTAAFFHVLGVPPDSGRIFSRGEEATAVVSHGYALRHSIRLGSVIRLNRVPFAVSAIMPKGFGGFAGKAEVWIALDQFERLFPQMSQFHFLADRGIHFLTCIGRLKPDATHSRALAELTPVAARIARTFPSENSDRGVTVESARAVLVGDTLEPISLLRAAVGLVLLMVCANLTGLLLVRGEGRKREFAIRSALGASRGVLIRQLMAETLVLTLAAGAVGFLGAFWMLGGLLQYLPVNLPPVFDFELGWQSGLLTLLLALTVASIVGLVTALRAASESSGGSLSSANRRTATCTSTRERSPAGGSHRFSQHCQHPPKGSRVAWNAKAICVDQHHFN